jgi:hypothetical protein
METETIDRLFLELSQFTRATTGKELALANQLAEAKAEIERLRGMLISALDGLDEYWVTFPEGVELVNQIKALQQKDNE